jgi:hypothetical protein
LDFFAGISVRSLDLSTGRVENCVVVRTYPLDSPRRPWQVVANCLGKLETIGGVEVMQNNSGVHTSLTGQPWGLFLLFAVALVAVTSAVQRQVGAASGGKTLRVRNLEIVDGSGVARMRLGTPLPDPSMGGKTSPRRSPLSGIQINDAKGDEMGGLGMLDDGSLILCFDSRTAEAICMYVLPSGERGFSVADNQGKDRAIMALNPDKSVSLSLNDDQGKPKAQIQLSSGGSPEIRLTTPDGKLLWATPQSHSTN